MSLLFEGRLQERWAKERSTLLLRSDGEELLLFNLFRANDLEQDVLHHYQPLHNEELYILNDRVQYSCHKSLSQYPLLSLLSYDATLHGEAEQLVVQKLKSSMYFALVCEDSTFNFTSVAEAAKEIRLILSSTAYVSKIKSIPKHLSTVETLSYLCNEITGRYTISQVYLKMVRNGWNVCSNFKDEQPLIKKPRIQKRRPNPKVKPPIQVEPFPFDGNDLDIEDVPDVNVVELDPGAISPTIRAEREIFRNQVLTSKEQFGLQYVTYRLTPSELRKVIQWINSVSPSHGSALAFLTMLTALKLHEVLGLHIALSDSDQDAFMQLDDSYGVINLKSGVYWRKELDISDRYQPTDSDERWLSPHSNWLKLPIPKPFLYLFRAHFNSFEAGLVEQILPSEAVGNASALLTTVCREIVHSHDFNRRLTHKALRYLLYGCVVSKYGRHKAALMFANNEFGLSTWHYYMSDKVCDLQAAFINTCAQELRFEFESDVFDSNRDLVVGTRLVLCKKAFSQQLAERVSLLKASLEKVPKSRSISTLRETYNQLVSYTVLMFSIVTSHRRSKSMFIEHYCWNDDYTCVLVADKIHFGESATRIIPVPELMTRQILNTLSWIEKIVKRLRLLDTEMAKKLSTSILRDGNSPFLGLWQSDGSLDTPSTSQIEVFMGAGWSLPQNVMRHLSYHALFGYSEAVPYLDHQMGHISSEMHSFQNTSVMLRNSSEFDAHRNVISKCLEELKFKVLGHMSSSNSGKYNKGQFAPCSIRSKTTLKSKNIVQTLQADLSALIDKAIKSNKDFYELLSEFYSDDPYLHEQALELVNKVGSDSTDSQDVVNIDGLKSALVGSFKKPPVTTAILPYNAMLSERYYHDLTALFYEFVQTLLAHQKKVSKETLGSALLFSMVLDGTGGLSPQALKKQVTINSAQYINGYMIAEMDEGGTTFFGGLSAILLAMLVKREGSQTITLNPKGLAALMNGQFQEDKVDKSIANSYKKFSAWFARVHNKSMTFSMLFRLIEHAPRRFESGSLYGLRQGTLRVKGLSNHTLIRMLDRKHRYVMPSNTETAMQIVPERTFFKKSRHSNEYYKKFMADFRQKFERYSGTSNEKIVRFWQDLVANESAKKLADLVKASHELPEILVLILAWLYRASGRKGQRAGGLAPSSIQTYFSKVAPSLCEFAANESLTTFDYEDFLDLYQDVIDSGDASSRSERAKILADFHTQIHEVFGVVHLDFRDLDVGNHETRTTGRMVMPWEYEQALTMLLTDKDANLHEQYINAAILIFCCRLGLRRQEVRRLKLRDFSLEDQVLHIRTHRISNETVRVKSKSGNRRVPYFLFLNDTEMRLLSWCMEQAEAQNKQSTPLFFDSMNPSEIRYMDSHFSRVIEALKLVTGDPSMRLHDGRHTFISFTATSLVLEDQQKDPISKVVKAWMRVDSLTDFQDRFADTCVATPSTRHALLPALALMVGHSNATTTLSSYTHLMEYWRWLSVETEFKKVKMLDGVLSELSSIPRKRLTEMKSEWGLSASFAVLKRLKKNMLPEVIGYQVEDSDVAPRLSLKEKDNITPVISEIQKIEKALRYHEDIEKQLCVDSDPTPISPSSVQYGLTQSYVECVRNAYQAVLSNHVSYRAYKIPSNEQGVAFMGQPRLYEARNYFKEPAFYSLLAHLIKYRDSNEEAFMALAKLWAHGWYDAKKKLYIASNQVEEAKAAFANCLLAFEIGKEGINRRSSGVVRDSLPVEQLSFKRGPISIPQFSHAMFLLILLRKL